MQLHRPRQLRHQGLDPDQPREALPHDLQAALELVSLPDNDFCWCRWADQAQTLLW
ncbi:hypothetical protein [Pseudomonas sp. Fl4BN1]|uniref:hypothetical protein n=1 Tax=Pseudomonas sp. Fl4BN1 TaxID=2697651 RepID=UPI00137696CF|nr:hypothetical protein [Pseudomonas sp. Fl4BN1]NBF10843.1 hypothetical protein [Pseudomonas sp. Fl4BN1]